MEGKKDMGLRETRGGNLVEYIIPIAVIGVVVGLGLFALINNGALGAFFAGSAGSNIDNSRKVKIGAEDKSEMPVINDAVSIPIIGGPLPIRTSTSLETTAEGTSANSLKTLESAETGSSCSNGICTISNGSWTLTGVPENMAEKIQTSGASGGMDEIAAMFIQIAANLDKDIAQDPDPSLIQYRNLVYTMGAALSKGNDTVKTWYDNGKIVTGNLAVTGYATGMSQVESKLSTLTATGAKTAFTDCNELQYNDLFINTHANIGGIALDPKYQGIKELVESLCQDARGIHDEFYSFMTNPIVEAGTSTVNKEAFDMKMATRAEQMDVDGDAMKALGLN